MDTNILLESGTNELEVLEFTLGNNHYGILSQIHIRVSKESSCRVIR